MLSDNAYHHHDAQQHQPAGFHTAPLEKVTLGIEILKTHSHSHSQIADNPLHDSKFPCGQCAAFSAVQFTADHASQAGCTVGLIVSQKAIKVRGHCKSHGDLQKIFGSWKPAQNCTTEKPSTSVPLVCPTCPHKRTLCIGHPQT